MPQMSLSKRLFSIDALRGLAALGVLLYHDAIRLWPTHSSEPTELVSLLASVLRFGSTGVQLFFVISGFCIHLRWAKSCAAGDNSIPDFVPFWKRRIWRLYPPYLAALALYLLVIGLQGKLRTDGFFWYDLGMHLGMVHNLDSRTVFSMNGVFWTLAIEEQLYLLYFVLLRVRIRYGWGAALWMTFFARIAAFGAFAALRRVAGVEYPVSESALANWLPWALGALSVEAVAGLVKLPRWACDLRICLLAILGAFLLTNTPGWIPHRALISRTTWFGLAYLEALAFWMLLNCSVAREKRDFKSSFLWRTLAAVGLFSYSLYLIHELPLHYALPLFERLLPGFDLTAQMVVLTPLSIGAAWLFHLAFERPFMPAPKQV